MSDDAPPGIVLNAEDAAWALSVAIDGPGAEDRIAGECRRLGLGGGPNPPGVALVAIMLGQHLEGQAERIRECLPQAVSDALDFGALERTVETLMLEGLARRPAWRSLSDPQRFVYLLAKRSRAASMIRVLAAAGATDEGSGEADVLLYCAKRFAADAQAEMRDLMLGRSSRD